MQIISIRFWLLMAGLLGFGGSANADIVFHYRFEGGPDGAPVSSLVDSGPNALHGTASGLTFTDDVAPFGGSGSFAANASGDFNFAERADDVAMHIQEFTLRALVNVGVPGGSNIDIDQIVTKKIAEAGQIIDSYSIGFSSDSGKFTGIIGFGGDFGFDDGVWLESSMAYSSGEWYSVALSLDRDVDGVTDVLSLYVNDELAAQASGDFPDIAYSSEELVIGAANYFGDSTSIFRRNFNGLIDEVMLDSVPIAIPEGRATAMLTLAGVVVFAAQILRKYL